VLLVAELNGEVVADTLEQGMDRLADEWQTLATQARRNRGQAQGIITVGGSPYLMTVVPLFLPTPAAWVFAGYAIDNQFVHTIQQTVVSDISILRYQRLPSRGTPDVTVVASTLAESDRDRLLRSLDTDRYHQTQRIALQDSDHGTLVRSLYGKPGDSLEFVAAIQRSYRENEENLQQLRSRLLQFYLAVIGVSVIGAFGLSRSVTRPVLALASRVRRIDQGDYRTVSNEERNALGGRDEIAELGASIDTMAAGLAEREKVRDLLGKVVSRDVAEELMSRRIELGGEEKRVSVLFVDVLGFTELSERHPPARVLDILNTYLSEMTRVIEDNRGIVDKYTGDAVMAVFGAPVSREDDIDNAVSTVLYIGQAVRELHRRVDLPALEIGIGLHTGTAVAGNIGSTSRMNYTVIGDSVNLASRLESLCRFYQVGNIVSGVTRERAGNELLWSRLDRVRVKGRTDAVDIYELLGRAEEVPPERMREVERFEEAFTLYQGRLWEAALEILRELESEQPRTLYRIHIERIELLYRENPVEWDGVFTFDHK